jgi:hypothetical protein
MFFFFFFWGGEFSQPGDPKKKKGAGESNNGIFEIFEKKKEVRHILTKMFWKSPDLDSVFL